MPAKKRREMNSPQDFIIHEIDISKELDVAFNFTNILLMTD
jgi:hypothetical protein